MIRMTVLYPAGEGKHFDEAYYLTKHIPLCKELLGGMGLVNIEVDRGLGGGAPGSPAPFSYVAHLCFRSSEDCQRALDAHGARLGGDVPNFTDIQPVILISQVIA